MARRVTRRLETILAREATAEALLEAAGAAAFIAPGERLAPSDQLLAVADEEAALLRHPYLGIEHVRLAFSTLHGDRDTYLRLIAEITEGLPRRRGFRWRPRGPLSMARPPAQRRLLQEQQAARHRRGGGSAS